MNFNYLTLYFISEDMKQNKGEKKLYMPRIELYLSHRNIKPGNIIKDNNKIYAIISKYHNSRLLMSNIIKCLQKIRLIIKKRNISTIYVYRNNIDKKIDTKMHVVKILLSKYLKTKVIYI